MLLTLPRYVPVENFTDKPGTLRDTALPGGFLVIQPGQIIDIPRETWLRSWRRNRLWLRRVTNETVPEEETPATSPRVPDPNKFLMNGSQITFVKRTPTRVYFIDRAGSERWVSLEQWDESTSPATQ